MSITLTSRIEALIRQKVETGPYRDVNEVIGEALWLLEARDRRVQHIWDSVTEGFAELERGEGIELTAETMEVRGRRAEERARHGDVLSPDVCL